MTAIAHAFRRAARRALEQAGWLGPLYRYREGRIALDASPWRETHAGLPTPPPLLVAKVAGHADLDLFIRQGLEIAAFLKGLAERSSASLSGEVLDFGCGCGRLARVLAPEVIGAGGAYTGVDINAALVAWCGDALPGRYVASRLDPPSPLPDARYDTLVSVSVFTHLPEAKMKAWLGDFRRVLRPGGVALVSFADEARVELADRERPDRPLAATLMRDGFATSTRALEGSNFMSSYATCEAFAGLAASEGCHVREIVPSRRSGQTLAWAALVRP